MENKTKVWYNPAIIELRRNGQRRIERALELVAIYSDKHSEMPYLPSLLRTRFEIWAGSPLTSFFEVFEVLKKHLVWHKELFQPSDDDVQKAISKQLNKSATENAYNKVLIDEEWKNLVKRGLNKIGFALDLLEHRIPGCSDRYYAMTSTHFRRQAAEQAGGTSVSVFQIYRWLTALMRHKGNSPFPALIPKKTVKEAVYNGKIKHKTKKEPFRAKDRTVRHYIPAHEKRAEDYVNGVKYRVIVYFGRNVK